MLLCGVMPCRPVCTLADLDAYLAQQHKVESYNDLHMGPLLLHDLVQANFKPPAHLVEVPKVTSRLLRGSSSDACNTILQCRAVQLAYAADGHLTNLCLGRHVSIIPFMNLKS